MRTRPSISIVGPGRLGRALALALYQAGYEIDEIVSRNPRASIKRAASLALLVDADDVTAGSASLRARVIWFCVPDRAIAAAAADLAKRTSWKGKVALHASGALTSDELDPLRQKGASVASVHPLMTFVDGSQPNLAGIPFGLEGDAPAVRAAMQIVHALDSEGFTVSRNRKAAYHAWGAFASPLFLAALVTAESVAAMAGVRAEDARRRMLPILVQTLSNYVALGPAKSFSGPIVRGDLGTVKQHLELLRKNPEAREVYLALARVALKRLPVGNRKQIAALLKNP